MITFFYHVKYPHVLQYCDGSYINQGVQGHHGSNSYMRLLVASWCLREVLFLRFLVQPVQRSQTSVPIYKITNFISWGIERFLHFGRSMMRSLLNSQFF